MNGRQLVAHIHTFNAYKHERKLAEDFAASLAMPNYAYSRCLHAGGSAYVVAYCYDKTSPTGVSRVASCLDFDEAVRIMDSVGRPFPLSPTEGLNKSGAKAY